MSAMNIASNVAQITVGICFIILGANIATAIIGVKFGGCGIILLSAKTNINPRNQYKLFITL
tara:strand:+ start:241 stop:426 length:186 start_codon:yes stop_codon:yes gene_type:complete